MSDKITISVAEGQKNQLTKLAHADEMSLSRFLSSKERYTYIALHHSGKIKIGVSSNPVARASLFGKLVMCLIGEEPESYLLSKLHRCEPPPDKLSYGSHSEWVDNDLDEVIGIAIDQTYSQIDLDMVVAKSTPVRGTDYRRKNSLDRSKSIIVKVTEQEHDAAHQKAQEAQMGLSEYTRRLLFSDKGHL